MPSELELAKMDICRTIAEETRKQTEIICKVLIHIGGTDDRGDGVGAKYLSCSQAFANISRTVYSK